MQGYSVEPVDDNIYHWELKFFEFDKSEPLYKDMQKMNIVRTMDLKLCKSFWLNIVLLGPYNTTHYISGNIPVCSAIHSRN